MLKALVVDFHDDKNISKKVVDAVLEVVINVVEIHHKDTSELKHFYCEEKYDVVFFIFNGKKEDSGFVRAELNKADYPRDANKEDEIHAYYESRTKCLISEYNITEYSYLLSAVDALFNTPLVRTMELGKLNTLLKADYSDIGDALIRIASMSMRLALTEGMTRELEKNRGTGGTHRSIEFPPEYYQAGLGILYYFSTIIRQRYPEIPVTVRIEQEGLTVRMSVETPEGQREIVEKTLEAYGLVVTGKMAPEELLEDPYHVMALKHKLDIANMELRHARDHLQLTGQHQQARITSLEAEVTHLRQFIGGALQYNQEITGMFKSLLATFTQQHDAAVHQALSTLKDAVERGITADDEQTVKAALTTIQEKEPGVFRQVLDLVGKGAITGASGRLLYDFLTHLSANLR